MNTRSVTFNFKTLDSAKVKDFAGVIAAMTAASIAYDETVEQGVVTAVKRKPLTVELPVYTVSDFPTDFVQNLLDKQVAEAAKKQIDKFLPVDASSLTPAEVVKILETSGGDAGSSVSKELVAACSGFVRKVLEAAGGAGAKARVDIICGLLDHKFSKKAIKANILIAPKIPQMFEMLGKIYDKNPEAFAQHEPVLSACYANYEKFLAEQQEAEDLEFAI